MKLNSLARPKTTKWLLASRSHMMASVHLKSEGHISGQIAKTRRCQVGFSYYKSTHIVTANFPYYAG